jgi:hypothetical protein
MQRRPVSWRGLWAKGPVHTSLGHRPGDRRLKHTSTNGATDPRPWNISSEGDGVMGRAFGPQVHSARLPKALPQAGMRGRLWRWADGALTHGRKLHNWLSESGAERSIRRILSHTRPLASKRLLRRLGERSLGRFQKPGPACRRIGYLCPSVFIWKAPSKAWLVLVN